MVLLLTKPADVIRKPGKDPILASTIQRRYPVAARQLLLRAQRYNVAIAAAKRYQREGRVLILSPADTFGVDTLKPGQTGSAAPVSGGRPGREQGAGVDGLELGGYHNTGCPCKNDKLSI